jgi:hypothetical protein
VFLLIVVSAQAWVPRVAFGLCTRVHPKSLAAIEGVGAVVLLPW